jgi:hypothetical protein
MTTEHAPPVPPDDLKEKWLDEWESDSCPVVPFVCPEPTDMAWFFSDRAAAWGWEQAIPEREELAELIGDLLYEVEHAEANCGLLLDDTTLTARARAAAERLRGGGQ